MSAPGTPTPAGWYPDPRNPTVGRYWDGTAWTDAVHVPGQPQPIPQAPPGTDPYTPWIWLVIFLPVLSMLLLLFVPWGSMFDLDPTAPNAYEGTRGMLQIFASPFYWLAVLLAYPVYGLSVFFAYRDTKELTARGVVKPFHWAFAFIGGAVYPIGRSIVVTRRTGRGHATLWAEVGVIVASIAVVTYIMIVVFSGMAQLFASIPLYR